MLELRFGGDDVFFPAVRVFEVPPEGAVEPLGTALLEHTLAVGRIADDEALICGQTHLRRVRLAELDQLADARLACVLLRDLQRSRVNVGAEDAVLAPVLTVERLGPGLLPDRLRDAGPLLRHERPVQTRRAVQRDHRRFDADRARAAERVPEEVPSAVAREIDHGGRHRLVQRRKIGLAAVAALVQAHAGRVQKQLHMILHDGKAQLIRFARLRQPAEAVFLAQPRDGGLLDDGLTVGNGVQLAVQTVALDGERAVLRDKALERHGLHALEQVLKAVRVEFGQQNHHALAHAAAEVGLRHSGEIAFKKNAPVLDPDVLQIQPPQFVADQTLQPKQARHAESHRIHSFLSKHSIVSLSIRNPGANSKPYLLRFCKM